MPQGAIANYRTIVGRNIKRLRGGTTQEQMGDQVRGFLEGQWSKATVSAVENGKRPLDVTELVIIAIVLDTSVANLLAPAQDEGIPMADTDRVRLLNKKTSVTAGEVRQAVAPTTAEQASEIVKKMNLVLQGSSGILTVTSPKIGPTGKTFAPKVTRRTKGKTR